MRVRVLAGRDVDECSPLNNKIFFRAGCLRLLWTRQCHLHCLEPMNGYKHMHKREGHTGTSYSLRVLLCCYCESSLVVLPPREHNNNILFSCMYNFFYTSFVYRLNFVHLCVQCTHAVLYSI